jgi:acyl-coenzyme A thioesterase 13
MNTPISPRSEMGVLFMHVQEEVIVDGSVVRSGRNLSVVAVEFKLEKTGQLIYTARATFYHMPVAKL